MSSIQESSSPDGADGVLDRFWAAVEPVRRTVLDPLWRHVVDPIRRSATLSLATLGAILFVLGAAVNQGPVAAILAIWGAGLLLIGLSIYAIIWLKRR